MILLDTHGLVPYWPYMFTKTMLLMFQVLRLKANNLSYKKAQPKPTKADPKEQDVFKKMAQTLDTLESSSEITVYALDETSVRVEWQPLLRP